MLEILAWYFLVFAAFMLLSCLLHDHQKNSEDTFMFVVLSGLSALFFIANSISTIAEHFK